MQVVTLSDHCRTLISAKPLHFSQTLAPETIFSSFANDSWAIWLDSGNSDHIDSRYDIMVWQPEITLVTVEQATTINHLAKQTTETSFEDPIKLLQSAYDELHSKYTFEPSVLPFIGGAVGYYAYDLGRRFEVIPTIAKKDIEIPEMAQGLYTRALVFDKTTSTYHLICPEPQRGTFEQALYAKVAANHVKETFSLTTNWQANISKAQYREKFDSVQRFLKEGDCYQINLTQRFTAKYSGSEFSAYLALRKENKAPFSAFMRFDDFAILSVSPERFLRVKNKVIETKPIKGTLPRSSDSKTDKALANKLQHSEKDRAENLMIVDLLRNDISKASKPGSVKVPKLFDIESFPAVHHLVSTVVGELASDKSALDLLRGAFPGGSITGAPKIRAMEIIDELEPQRRNIYCGSIGYLSACGNMDTSITIRTLACENLNIHCWAGGGIVADSNVDAEYQESLDKVNKILPILSKKA